MTNKVLRRAAEPAHVVATKNLADVYVKAGGKRATFLESQSKRMGFKNWNAYSSSGKSNLRILAKGFSPIEVGPGVYYLSAEADDIPFVSLLKAAKAQGYTCDHSAPLVISDDVLKYPTMAKLMKLRLSKSFDHRSFVAITEIAPHMMVDLIAEKISGMSGLIVLDFLGMAKEDFETLGNAAPDAIIIHMDKSHHEVGELLHIPSTLKSGKSGEEAFYLSNDMWGERTKRMLRSFAEAGVTYDPLNKPLVEDLPRDHPTMIGFLQAIPGFQMERHKQNLKVEEQFSFLTMPL